MVDDKCLAGNILEEDLPHASAFASQGMFKFHPQSSDNRLNLVTLLHINVTWASIQNLLTRFEAQLAAPAAFSINYTDSYNGDDAWHFFHE